MHYADQPRREFHRAVGRERLLGSVVLMTFWERFRRVVLGPPKDVEEPHAFHKLSLIAFLAWVGLGAEGLSSSAYGPEETFRQLGQHVGLAVFLAAAMIRARDPAPAQQAGVPTIVLPVELDVGRGQV